MAEIENNLCTYMFAYKSIFERVWKKFKNVYCICKCKCFSEKWQFWENNGDSAFIWFYVSMNIL